MQTARGLRLPGRWALGLLGFSRPPLRCPRAGRWLERHACALLDGCRACASRRCAARKQRRGRTAGTWRGRLSVEGWLHRGDRNSTATAWG